jgi:hypothetical protein
VAGRFLHKKSEIVLKHKKELIELENSDLPAQSVNGLQLSGYCPINSVILEEVSVMVDTTTPTGALDKRRML